MNNKDIQGSNISGSKQKYKALANSKIVGSKVVASHIARNLKNPSNSNSNQSRISKKGVMNNPNEPMEFYKFYINGTKVNKEKYHLKSNYISTTKYNVITFLPKSLILQFTRLPNIYFLFIAIIQSIPAISPLTSVTAILPLVFVLCVSMARELIEDIARYKYDKQSNSHLVKVLRDNQFIEAESSSIQVGEILQISENDEFPCDMILLDSTNKGGVCYIETGSLDGEKNLKTKTADKDLKSCFYINASKDDNEKRNLDVTAIKNYEDITGFVECDMPNPELYTFDGKMKFKCFKGEDNYVLSVSQLLLKGALLRQTKQIIGICVYSGKNNKILLNSKSSIFKTSRLEALMNRLLVFIFILQLVLCIICAIMHSKYEKDNRSFLDGFIFQGDILGEFKSESFLSFFTYLLLLNTMIPISLMVTIEIVKVIQGFFIGFDCGLFSHERKKFCKANAVSIIEELGKINYIFSDKTGTLTCNKMEFKYCIIGNCCYEYCKDAPMTKKGEKTPLVEKNHNIEIRIGNNGAEISCNIGELMDEPLQAERERNNKLNGNGNANGNMTDHSKVNFLNNYTASNNNLLKVGESEDVLQSLNRQKTTTISPIKVAKNHFLRTLFENKMITDTEKHFVEKEFFYALSIGNEVMPIINKRTNEIDYNGLSPDDIELVRAAANQGFRMVDSTNEYKIIELGNRTEKYEILNLFGFTSDRKRMSIIVKGPDGKIKMYTKGADSEIKNRLKLEQNQKHLITAIDCSEFFSQKGFRNLFVAMKEIKPADYDEFSRKLKECELTLENKAKLVANCINEMEKGYTLLGATIVEDKLQENVPETIRDLRFAGIKVWMLTGDKIDTAENISLSCNLISKSQKCFKIYPLSRRKSRQYETKAQGDQLPIPELENFLDEYNEFKTNSPNEKFSLLIESSVLAKIFSNDDPTRIFIEIALMAESVVCCRVSPLQKSLVVQKVKMVNENAVTLAIGDGGNDVSMILEAHVGIGIHGEEGVLAVQSSDFSIGEFQYLKRLLFFHGRNSLNRTGNMVNYFFFKNFVFTIIQFYFCFYNIGSGQTLIDDWYITLFNLVFTSLPLAAQALTNFDVLEEDSEQCKFLMPRLYNETRENPTFTISSFSFTIAQAIIYSIFNFFFTFTSVKESAMNKDGDYADIWSNSLSLYTVIIFSVTNNLFVKQSYVVMLFVIIILISSWLFYVLFCFVAENNFYFNSSGAVVKTLNSGKFYLNFFLIVGLCFILDYAIYAFGYLFQGRLYADLMIFYKNNFKTKLPDNVKEEIKTLREQIALSSDTPRKDQKNTRHKGTNVKLALKDLDKEESLRKERSFGSLGSNVKGSPIIKRKMINNRKDSFITDSNASEIQDLFMDPEVISVKRRHNSQRKKIRRNSLETEDGNNYNRNITFSLKVNEFTPDKRKLTLLKLNVEANRCKTIKEVIKHKYS
ncbi:MAG: phospholipid-translocating P-type ATPase [archaeon]|nr:phospholipid-translocating P-type ATPase [archaeon]